MKRRRDSRALPARVRELEKRSVGQKWGVSHGVYATLRIVICGFMVLWACAAGLLIFQAVRKMIQDGRPLVINGKPTTWAASVSYVAMILIIGVAGPACLAFALRMIRTSLKASRDVPANRDRDDR